MLEFAELLNEAPASVMEDNVQGLRDVGWTDEDIIDIVHITALYNYMVRIADGLGIEIDTGEGWESTAQSLPFRNETAPKTFGKIVAGPLD